MRGIQAVLCRLQVGNTSHKETLTLTRSPHPQEPPLVCSTTQGCKHPINIYANKSESDYDITKSSAYIALNIRLCPILQ